LNVWPDINKYLKKYFKTVDFNSLTDEDLTILHFACINSPSIHGAEKIVKMLINYGVNINLVDSCGRTPLHSAILYNEDNEDYKDLNNIKVIEMLIRAGVRPKRPTLGRSPECRRF